MTFYLIVRLSPGSLVARQRNLLKQLELRENWFVVRTWGNYTEPNSRKYSLTRLEGQLLSSLFSLFLPLHMVSNLMFSSLKITSLLIHLLVHSVYLPRYPHQNLNPCGFVLWLSAFNWFSLWLPNSKCLEERLSLAQFKYGASFWFPSLWEAGSSQSSKMRVWVGGNDGHH